MSKVITFDCVSKRYFLDRQRASDFREALTGLLRRRNHREEFLALKDVSFEVEAGEALGIIGPNGAGKSTILKILSKITKPTRGFVEVKGKVAALIEVGAGFHPDLTGRDNAYLSGSILGLTRREIDKKFDSIVDFAGLEQFIDVPVKRYSSGMYMRLGFAVAAHLESDILLIDEVLAVGDATFQKKCLGKMRDVTNQGRTVLFVSHNMSAILDLTDSVLLLEHGVLRAQGQPAQIVNQYLANRTRQHIYDIEHESRQYKCSMLVKFVRVELLEHHDGRVPYGRDLAVLLTVESFIDAKNLRFSATIFTQSGNPVGSLFTTDHFNLRRGERATFRVTLSSLNLSPGHYYNGFAVGTGDYKAGRIDYDGIIGYPQYEVIPNMDAPLAINVWHHQWGNVVFEKSRVERL